MSSVAENAQRFVNSFDDGIGLKALRAVLLFCLLAGIFGGYAYFQFRGLWTPEAMEYAQLGRNMAEGKGFVTSVVRPRDLKCIEKQSGNMPLPDAMPDIRTAPGYAALLAGAFRLVGAGGESPAPFRVFEPELRVILPMGIVLTLLTALFVYLIARRVFDRRIALISLFAYACTDAVLINSISGGALPLLTAISTASVYFALVSVCAKEKGYSFLRWFIPFTTAAVLAGLGVLAGYTMLIMVPVLATFVCLPFTRGRLLVWLLFACVVAAVVSPWGLRNHRMTGSVFGSSPYTAMHDTVLYAGDTFDRSMEATPGNVLVFQALKRKLTSQLVDVWENSLQALGSGLAICFFLASFFHVFRRREANALRWCLGGGVIAMVFAVAIGGSNMGTRLSVFLPWVVVFGSAFFVALTDRILIEDEWKSVFSGLFVFLVALPALVRASAMPAQNPYPPYYPPFVSYTCSMLEDDEIVCSDIPWATAWYGNRESILLPVSTDDFMALNEEWHPLSGLLITAQTYRQSFSDALIRGQHESWWPVLNRRVPEGFPLTHGISLPPDGYDQLFLTDKIRWPEDQRAELAEDVTDEIRIRERILPGSDNR